jgi:hypothetical protein
MSASPVDSSCHFFLFVIVGARAEHGRIGIRRRA